MEHMSSYPVLRIRYELWCFQPNASIFPNKLAQPSPNHWARLGASWCLVTTLTMSSLVGNGLSNFLELQPVNMLMAPWTI